MNSTVSSIHQLNITVGRSKQMALPAATSPALHSPRAPSPATDAETARELRADYVKKLGKGLMNKESLRKKVGIVDEQVERILADLEKHEWYHGFLPLEDIAGLLKQKGDFLIRALDPEDDKPPMACVTVKWDDISNHIVYFRASEERRLFTLDGVFRNTNIIDLVRFHMGSGTSIGKDVKLLRPIPKQKWELTKNKLTLEQKIGKGEFGEVFSGKLCENPQKPPIKVAIKVIKLSENNKEEVEQMHKEARLMRQYKHRNIVAFFGVVYSGNDSAMIVMELIHGGALNSYLKKNQELSNEAKSSYASDVAYALLYLHNKKCLHRDVACRNCLIDVQKQLVKLSDFGLSKQGDVYEVPKDEKTPVRWQAPEVFTTRQYTAKADVYAYGITVWEIFHNAEIPYPGIENKIIRQKIFDPEFRPAIDESVPTTWRILMKACWKGDPEKRPPMLGIVGYLRRDKTKSDTVEKKERNDFNKKEVSAKEVRYIRLNEITTWLFDQMHLRL
ncbi:hypothetical protein Aduo_011296 [Ancylostoma duodenale]